MNGHDIERLDKRVKVLLLGVSLATIVLLVASALRENFFPEWRTTRLRYAEILQEKATDEHGRSIAAQFEIGIDQIVLPELGATDRCITCHTGLQDPRMADIPQPHGLHPAGLLDDHPAEQFGCTSCHAGQGRATESFDAHGLDPDWPYPMLEKRFLYASCTGCHDSADLFGPPETRIVSEVQANRSGFEILERGKRLFEATGCQGCHLVGGRGGKVGPDISFVGDKTRHDFDFSHFGRDDPREVAHWLEKHFLEPGEVSPGTVMPDLNLTQDDAAALTAYTLSLRRRDAPGTYLPEPAELLAPPDPPTGEVLYKNMCSACHGSDGRASEVPGIRTPALNNPDSLAVASDDYYRFIIENGRTGTAMASWGGARGTLTRDEIDRIVEHIREWEAAGPNIERVSAQAGDAAMGEAYYHGLCANCHGVEGGGGIGNALNSPNFLGIASDRFLAETIVQGRPGTAMASWKHLPEQAVSDLIAFIRTWEPEPPEFVDVILAAAMQTPAELREQGAVLYRGRCAACHGAKGEGAIGPRLNSTDILPAVDDLYLYRTITEGRPTTAMPAWRTLSAEQIASVIAYVRSWNGTRRLDLVSPPPRGDYDLGEVKFKTACASCHGEKARGGVGPQLANPSFLSAISDEALFQWIGHGRTGTAMKGFLPEEEGPLELNAGHIADVIAYLRRLGAEPARPLLRVGEGDSELGARIYRANCAACHGDDGEGASGPQLHNAELLRAASDGFLTATIVLGRTGTAMQTMIHGQEGLGQIAPERVRDVVAYIRSWDAEASWTRPRAVAEMSNRAIDSGREKFARYCSSCHGVEGLGQAEGADYFAPALNNAEFLEAASDGFLLATIARGRSNTAMRPFGKSTGGIASLGAGEISDIVSFIRTWQEKYITNGDSPS